MKYDLAETGKRIREVRKMNGLTQEEFSEKLYMTVSHIGKIEQGIRGASIELLVDISCQFNVSLDYLVLGKSGCDMAESKAVIRSVIDGNKRAAFIETYICNQMYRVRGACRRIKRMAWPH